MEIINEPDAREFIKRLPEITQSPASCHLLMLIVRKKKALEMLNEKLKDAIMEKVIVNAMEDWRLRYFSKLYNLALLQHQGRYDSDQGVFIAPAAMGIFATIAPRDTLKSVEALTNENNKLAWRHDKEALLKLSHQSSTFFRLLHSNNRKGSNYVDFDIDEDDSALHAKVRDMVSPYPIVMDMASSKGYHITLNLSKGTDAGEFYKRKMDEVVKSQTYPHMVEFKEDPQLPIAGTYYSSKVRPEPNFVRLIN